MCVVWVSVARIPKCVRMNSQAEVKAYMAAMGTKLQQPLEDALNAAVKAQAQDPRSFFAEHFASSRSPAPAGRVNFANGQSSMPAAQVRCRLNATSCSTREADAVLAEAEHLLRRAAALQGDDGSAAQALAALQLRESVGTSPPGKRILTLSLRPA